MFSNNDIDECIMRLAIRVGEGTLKNKQGCIWWCEGYFGDDVIPIRVLEYIDNLYDANIIK